MFIDFEGIDGSGKTTLSNLVAKALRGHGYRVCHARENGELRTGVARRVREVTRDASLLEMGARAELFLNLARDAQQVEEVIRPALSRGEVVLCDRYLYSPLTLAAAGRGLSEPGVAPALDLAAQGIWPDLVVLVDVDPELARLRKASAKSAEGRPWVGPSSRKGLAGAGLNVRIREAFLELSRQDRGRWLVLPNEQLSLTTACDRIVEIIRCRLEGREAPVQELSPLPKRVPEGTVEERFFALLDAWEGREESLCAHLLTGLPGLAAHQRRLFYAERQPALTAASLAGLEDAESFVLRRILQSSAPKQVAASLSGLSCAPAQALREELYPRAPAHVLQGLRREDSPASWRLREKGLADGALDDVLYGLAGVDTERAWEVRARGVERSRHAAVAHSLTWLAGGKAEAMRRELLPHARLEVLRSLTGMETPLAEELRGALFEAAPKSVLRSLAGCQAEAAWALRQRGVGRSKEALDSVDGLSDERAWKLREGYWEKWPSTAISSLKGLVDSTRGQALLARVLTRFGQSLSVVRNAYALVAKSQQAARSRSGHALAGGTLAEAVGG